MESLERKCDISLYKKGRGKLFGLLACGNRIVYILWFDFVSVFETF